MAPLPVIANTFRCAIHYSATGGAYAVNVIHLRSTTGSPTAATCGADIVAAWPNHMLTGIPSSVVVDTITVTPLDGITPAVDTSTGSAGEFVGEQTGNWIAQAATVVKLKTAKRGPRYRGRVFRPFTAEETATNGFLDAANVALLTTAWNSFVGYLGSHTSAWELVVASYKFATAELVTSQTAEAALATMKKRQDRLR